MQKSVGSRFLNARFVIKIWGKGNNGYLNFNEGEHQRE
jgi:hypothetical protein